MAFSVDGTKLAYTRGRLVANLWRVPILPDRLATWEDARQLTFDEALIEYVDVSPDGEHLLVSSDRKGNQDLWMLPVGGGEMRQLTTDPTHDWRPSFSPDGQEVAFYAYRSGNRDIWVMPLRGGSARRLTYDEASDANPAWSPDGEEIAFCSFRAGNWDIWVVPAEGGEPRQITFDTADDNYPRFSPDGKWVFYGSLHEGTWRLWRVPSDGGDPEPITKGQARYPIWSVDGNKIYFRSTRESRAEFSDSTVMTPGERAKSSTANLWALSLEDGAEYPVTDLAGKRGNLGLWGFATDGDYLYFTWQEDVGDIWVMDVVYE